MKTCHIHYGKGINLCCFVISYLTVIFHGSSRKQIHHPVKHAPFPLKPLLQSNWFTGHLSAPKHICCLDLCCFLNSFVTQGLPLLLAGWSFHSFNVQTKCSPLIHDSPQVAYILLETIQHCTHCYFHPYNCISSFFHKLTLGVTGFFKANMT